MSQEILNETIGDVENIVKQISKDEREALSSINQISEYVDYLCKWLSVHNVVSRKNTKAQLWQNIFDSLIFLADSSSHFADRFTRSSSILDAGAGGGIPGIPLAIIFPTKIFKLVDINRKKCSFLRSIKAKLMLKNVTVIQERIENVELHDFVVTKAAFPPERVHVLAQVVQQSGYLMIWATINTKDDFLQALNKEGLMLEAEQAYDLPNHPRRFLLLFRKK